MLFKPHLAEAILQSKKTQTRRLRKLTHSAVLLNSRHIIAVYTNNMAATSRNNRLLWRIGNTYAIQPGRGKKAIGRFRLLSIQQQPLQAITAEDARAEGLADYANPTKGFVRLWNSINTKPGTRWQHNPEVFVLTFELATPQTRSTQ